MTALRRSLLAVALLSALGLPAAPASAAAGAADEPLAPALQELAKPSVRALPRPAQARLLGIAASGPGSLIREGGRILVEARFESGAIARLPVVESTGGEVVASSQRYQQTTVNVPFSDLKELAAVPGVASVTPVRAPVVRAPNPCQGGSVISEGVKQLEVEALRKEFEEKETISKEGEGLTVGVLSDSFDQATKSVDGEPINKKREDDEATNDLPGAVGHCPGEETPVEQLHPYAVEPNQPPTDEGRAMLQIVHDVVPKAKLAFTSAFNGELAFAQGIKELAKPLAVGGTVGANVIVDDVSYFEEPFFQDGPVAVAIRKAVEAGVTYVTAAGNDNLIDSEGNEFASWEASSFRDSGDCPPAVRALSGTNFNPHHCLDFNPAAPVDRTFGIKVSAGATLTVDLQWREPWYGVDTDLDAFLLDAEGNLLTASTEDNVNETKVPVEVLQWQNESDVERTVQLVINRFQGETPGLKFILAENGAGVTGTEYPRSGGGDVVGPTVYGHAGSAAAVAVAAVRFNRSKKAEVYSSRGPVTHYFEPVESSSPAPGLLEKDVISKPDVAATDCNATTFFAFLEEGAWRFCGTSAAAPHAGGIAALAIEAIQAGGKTATPAEVRDALEGTGSSVGVFGSCAVGGGLLNAVGVVAAVNEELTEIPPSPCPPPSAEGAVFVAPGDWGRELPVEPEEPEEPEKEKQEKEHPSQGHQPKPTSPSTPPSTGPPTPHAKKAPSTSIVRHPPKVVGTHRPRARLAFRFAAKPASASFSCQFDGSAWRRCAARVTRWFGLGPHVMRVRAEAGGLADPSPAVFRFKVVRLHRTLRPAHRR